MPKSSNKDNELNDEADNGSKWLNTDSECELLTLSLYIYMENIACFNHGHEFMRICLITSSFFFSFFVLQILF